MQYEWKMATERDARLGEAIIYWRDLMLGSMI